MKKKIRCNHCKYEWETKSEHEYVCCPKCMYKVNINKYRIDKNEKDICS